MCQRALEEALRTAGALRESVTRPAATTGGGIHGRLTDRARGRGHRHLGTEHLLLGMLDEGANLGLRVLADLGVDPADVRTELEGVMATAVPSTGVPVVDKAALTPRAARVIELSTREALRLGHNYIGCEHLLLGLLDEGDGIAGQVLRSMGVELTVTRRAVTTMLAGFVHARANPPQSLPDDAVRQILERLDRLEQRLAG